MILIGAGLVVILCLLGGYFLVDVYQYFGLINFIAVAVLNSLLSFLVLVLGYKVMRIADKLSGPRIGSGTVEGAMMLFGFLMIGLSLPVGFFVHSLFFPEYIGGWLLGVFIFLLSFFSLNNFLSGKNIPNNQIYKN